MGDEDNLGQGYSFWSELPIEAAFPVLNIRWNANGSKLILLGRDRFCSCDIIFDETHTSAVLSVEDS